MSRLIAPVRNALSALHRFLLRETREDESDPTATAPRRRHYEPGMIWETALPVSVDQAVAAARAHAMAHAPGQWRDGHVEVELGIRGGQYCWIVCSDDALLPGDPDWMSSFDGFTDYFVSAWTGRCIGRRGYPGNHEHFLPGEDLRDRRSRPQPPVAPSRGSADGTAP